MGKGQYQRKRRTCEWDAPRLLAVIEFVNACPGGEIQVSVDKLREVTGIPMQSLKRHIGWAVEYGALEVEVEYQFGRGRLPNLYRAKLTLEQWMELGAAVVAAYREKAPPVVVGAEPPPPKPIEPPVDPGVSGWDQVK